VAELGRVAMAELRSLIAELRPADLDADGLVSALRDRVEVLRRAQPVPIELHVRGERRLPRDHERQLFRIASEALGNALTHAAASRIRVALDIADDRVHLGVEDDGAGFDPSDQRLRSTRLGLESMRARARALHGRLEVSSSPGAGTAVTADVPLDRVAIR
jgi:signal transduction histidine kinase